jgi:hypothetical protein
MPPKKGADKVNISVLESPLTRKASAAALAAAGLGGSAFGAFAIAPAHASETGHACDSYQAGALGIAVGELTTKIGDGYSAGTALQHTGDGCINDRNYNPGDGMSTNVQVVKSGVGICSSSGWNFDNGNDGLSTTSLDWSNGCGSGQYSNWGQGRMRFQGTWSNVETAATPNKAY